MSGRQSSATDRALKAWKPWMQPSQVTALAVRYGINPSTLYRALIREGLIAKGS